MKKIIILSFLISIGLPMFLLSDSHGFHSWDKKEYDAKAQEHKTLRRQLQLKVAAWMKKYNLSHCQDKKELIDLIKKYAQAQREYLDSLDPVVCYILFAMNEKGDLLGSNLLYKDLSSIGQAYHEQLYFANVAAFQARIEPLRAYAKERYEAGIQAIIDVHVR